MNASISNVIKIQTSGPAIAGLLAVPWKWTGRNIEREPGSQRLTFLKKMSSQRKWRCFLTVAFWFLHVYHVFLLNINQTASCIFAWTRVSHWQSKTILHIPTYLKVAGMKDTKLIHRWKNKIKLYFGLKYLNFTSNIIKFWITYMNGWGRATGL